MKNQMDDSVYPVNDWNPDKIVSKYDLIRPCVLLTFKSIIHAKVRHATCRGEHYTCSRGRSLFLGAGSLLILVHTELILKLLSYNWYLQVFLRVFFYEKACVNQKGVLPLHRSYPLSLRCWPFTFNRIYWRVSPSWCTNTLRKLYCTDRTGTS